MNDERFLAPQEGTQILIQTANFSQGLLPLQARLLRAVAYEEPGLRVQNSDLNAIYTGTLTQASAIVFRGIGRPEDPTHKYHPLTDRGNPITPEAVRENVDKQVEFMRMIFKHRLNPAEMIAAQEEIMIGGITLEQIIFSSRLETLKAIGEGMLERERYFAGKRGSRTFFVPYVLESRPTELPVLDRIFAGVKAQLHPSFCLII